MSESIVSQNPLVELGRKTPVLLIEMVKTELFEKVTEWLKDNSAPEEIYQAVGLVEMLNIYIQRIGTGVLSDLDAESIPNDLTDAAAFMIKFGGDLFGGGAWNAGESQIPTPGEVKPTEKPAAQSPKVAKMTTAQLNAVRYLMDALTLADEMGINDMLRDDTINWMQVEPGKDTERGEYLVNYQKLLQGKK